MCIRDSFHRAISESGGCSVGVRSASEASAAAAAISTAVGCDSAADELACLRDVPVAELSDEGTLFAMGATPITTEEDYQAELFTRYGSDAAAIELLYPASAFGGSYQKAIVRVSGDSSLVCSTYDVAKRVADAKTKTYVYNFARVPPLAFITALDLGAFHGLEIAYVFGTITPPTATDAGLGTKMRAYWTSFAEKGKPKAAKAAGWPAFKSKSYKMLRLNADVSLLKDFRRAQCDLWTSLYESGNY